MPTTRLESAVVVRSRSRDDILVSDLFPGWHVLHAGHPVAGLRFKRIVVTVDPTAIPFAQMRPWFDNLQNRMAPGGQVEWLA